MVTGGLAFVFGFAMVWHMWWLAILGVLLIVLTLILRSSDDDTEYLLPASEVEKIETRRCQEMAKAPRRDAGAGCLRNCRRRAAGAGIVTDAMPASAKGPRRNPLLSAPRRRRSASGFI